MRRDKFLALHSPYFEKAFGPSNQHRVLRRRGLVNKLPAGIKYVLDLTPPMEGDDAVYLMTELCCSAGVRRWFQSAKRWNVSKRLVGGKDETSTEPILESTGSQAPQGVEQSEIQNTNGTNTEAVMDLSAGEGVKGGVSVPFEVTPSMNVAPSTVGEVQMPTAPTAKKKLVSSRQTADSLPLEYTAVRHRSAIERVLVAAVEGLDPRIDSAPKLWTTFAVAKYFEITHSPLTDYIVSWLRATPNSYFLEVLPETSQKIADGLQCEDLCRDVFAILVGEEALGNVCGARLQARGRPACSVYGRRREDLHEDYQTRIEYASKSFVDRVNSRFDELVDERMIWLDQIPAFSVLSDLEGGMIDDDRTIEDLKKSLRAYVRGRIYWIGCRTYQNLRGPVPDTKFIGSDLFPTASFTATYNGLLLRERIFTQSFWKTLQLHDFSQGNINTYTDECHPYRPIAGWTPIARANHSANLFDEVYKRQLQILVNRLDERCAKVLHSENLRISQDALPHRPDRPSLVDWFNHREISSSLETRSKPGINADDKSDNIGHDEKRRRLSEVSDDRPYAGSDQSRLSTQLPIRAAPMTQFSQEINNNLKHLRHDPGEVATPVYSQGKVAQVFFI